MKIYKAVVAIVTISNLFSAGQAEAAKNSCSALFRRAAESIEEQSVADLITRGESSERLNHRMTRAIAVAARDNRTVLQLRFDREKFDGIITEASAKGVLLATAEGKKQISYDQFGGVTLLKIETLHEHSSRIEKIKNSGTA